MTTLPLATRACGMVPDTDPHARATLRSIQSYCLLVSLSLVASMLVCGALGLPLTGLAHCETLAWQSLLLIPAITGLSQLNPDAPGPDTPVYRRRLARGSGWLLITAALIALAHAFLPPLSEATAGTAVVLPPASSLSPALRPVLTAFLLVQGALLLELSRRSPGKGRISGLLALTLLGLCLLALMGWSLAVESLAISALAPTAVPLTLISMFLLGTASFAECAQRPGMLSVLTSFGIGGRRVRSLILPALVLPAIAVMGVLASVDAGFISVPLAAALYTSVITVFWLFVLLREGDKVNRMEAGLRLASLTDDLTHLYNRRAFMVLGEQAMREARRQGHALSVLYFDLDHLKPVNDAFGHAMGSRLLEEFADILRHSSRASDIVARIGGDEFAVVTPASADDLERQVQRIAIAVSERNRHGRRPYLIRYSLGRCSCDPAHCESFEAIVAEADSRMYAEKQRKAQGPGRLAMDSVLVLDRS